MKHPALATPFFNAVRGELAALGDDIGLEALNAMADARGLRVRFVSPHENLSGMGYEISIDATGEVPTRDNPHDFFNALQWLAFPRMKAAINAGHLRHLEAAGQPRSPARNVLTMIDESGVLVASEDASLLQLLREFRWQELFVNRRQEVVAMMRFALVGHGLMEKSLAPFIGLTGKAILLNVPDSTSLDAAASAWIDDEANLSSSRNLAPLPLLGIPGWDARNEEASFYGNTDYFRPGRRGMPGGA